MGIASLFEFLICFSVYIILRFDIFVNYFQLFHLPSFFVLYVVTWCIQSFANV